MNRRIRPLLAAAALLLAAVPAAAPAQDGGWYVGLGIGRARSGDGCTGAAPPGITCDDKDTTWKIFGGYEINQYLGVELGLVDLGERPASVTGVGAGTAKFRIFETLVVGTLPIGERFSVYGKAGIFQWDADYSFPAGTAGGADSQGKDYTYGLGVRYHFTRNAALRLEAQRYKKVGEASMTGQFDVDVFALGVLFRF